MGAGNAIKREGSYIQANDSPHDLLRAEVRGGLWTGSPDTHHMPRTMLTSSGSVSFKICKRIATMAILSQIRKICDCKGEITKITGESIYPHV